MYSGNLLAVADKNTLDFYPIHAKFLVTTCHFKTDCFFANTRNKKDQNSRFLQEFWPLTN